MQNAIIRKTRRREEQESLSRASLHGKFTKFNRKLRSELLLLLHEQTRMAKRAGT